MHNLNLTLEKDGIDYKMHLEQITHQDPDSTREKPLPPMGVTLKLWGEDEDGEFLLFAEGSSQRHPMDNWCRIVGRKLAWERLLDSLPTDREVRTALWAVYKRLFRYIEPKQQQRVSK